MLLMTLAAFDFVLGHELAVAANMARDGSALRIKARNPARAWRFGGNAVIGNESGHGGLDLYRAVNTLLANAAVVSGASTQRGGAFGT